MIQRIAQHQLDLVWLDARLSCSACSGVTSMFTTCTMIGLPSASFLKSWPADSTSIFCSRVLRQCAQVVDCRPGVLPEIRTSTCVPGTTKPATPTTSFTRTATARIPGGIIAAIPPPAPFGARRDSMIGSLAKIGRDHAAADDILDLGAGAHRHGARPFGRLHVLLLDYRADFQILGCQRQFAPMAGAALVVCGRLISTR